MSRHKVAEEPFDKLRPLKPTWADLRRFLAAAAFDFWLTADIKYDPRSGIVDIKRALGKLLKALDREFGSRNQGSPAHRMFAVAFLVFDPADVDASDLVEAGDPELDMPVIVLLRLGRKIRVSALCAFINRWRVATVKHPMVMSHPREYRGVIDLLMKHVLIPGCADQVIFSTELETSVGSRSATTPAR